MHDARHRFIPEEAEPGPASDALAELEWRLRHASRSTRLGDYPSVARGRGVEFEQVVKHEWGDDLRDIDWNVTARLGEPYRKQFTEDRDLTVLLVFEDTPELQFGSAGRTRREVLRETAVLLLLGALRRRDRAGLLYASPEGLWLRRPSAHRETVRHTAKLLLDQPPPALDGGARAEEPWRLALRAAPPHSVLVWLGAFAPGPEPEDWPALSRRYQVVGCRADDPWDEGLPATGPLAVFDPVTGAALEFDPRAAANRRAHAAWACRRDDGWAALLPDERTRLTVRTDAPVLDRLLDFFHRQARGSGRA